MSSLYHFTHGPIWFIQSMESPSPTIQEMLLWYLVCFIAIALCDIFIARFTKARWFALHFIANLWVVLFSLEDVVRAYSDPIRCMDKDQPYTRIPLYIVAMIHFYHLIAFRDLRFNEWMHHLVFGGVICFMGSFSHWGPLQNLYGFYLSGLPGGLDYLMLVLVKHGYMDSLMEKEINARINTWLRSPGCMSAAFITAMAWRYGEPVPPLVFVFLGGFLCAFNGQYYAQMVIGNTYRKSRTYSS